MGLISCILLYFPLIHYPLQRSARRKKHSSCTIRLPEIPEQVVRPSKRELDATIVEIKDLRKRSGKWGFFKTAFGSLFGRHTKIEPEKIDLTGYQNIILGSPIWTGKLSMAIRTVIDRNSFEGKKVLLYTTTNAYEKEKYKEKARKLVRKAGGNVVGYYQILAKEKVNGKKIDRTREQIIEDTLYLVPEIRLLFSSQH